ncbi:MAG TPA: hypothetical protein VHC22_20555 [Pirellulales bacterium]|nr:hypothetical protein [Pirellulales bacterium]
MVRNVLNHTTGLLPESDCPIQHFERSANAGHSLIKYIDDHIDPNDIYEAVYERHLGHLRRMAMAELIESFERFLKELASLCLDCLAPYAVDDRFDEFMPKGERIGAFVNAQSIGKALCESDTWLKNKTISERFKVLLQHHFGDKWENLFPEPNQLPVAERERAKTLSILWQIRHNLAHNVGVITHSDSMKFRVLIGGAVGADCRLTPSIDDLRYVKRFLTETANHTNQRVGTRLADVLTNFHQADPTLFDAQEKANEISARFARSLTVSLQAGVL